MERIVIGSGKLYIDEFTSTIPEDTVIEVEEKLLGYIQGGATLTYSPSYYEANVGLCKDIFKQYFNGVQENLLK